MLIFYPFKSGLAEQTVSHLLQTSRMVAVTQKEGAPRFCAGLPLFVV
jgi:hypothetical protein